MFTPSVKHYECRGTLRKEKMYIKIAATLMNRKPIHTVSEDQYHTARFKKNNWAILTAFQ